MSYEYFIELYNGRSVPVDEIKKELGRANYERYRKIALKRGDISQRPFNLRFNGDDDKVKYYHFDKKRKKYRVRRVIKGKYNDYGFYESENEAKKVVKILKSNDWDESILKEFLEKEDI